MLSTKALRLKSKREAKKLMESAYNETGCSSSKKKAKVGIPFESDVVPVACEKDSCIPNETLRYSPDTSCDRHNFEVEEVNWSNNESLKEKIRLWAMKHGLTTTVVNELLEILRVSELKVPKDEIIWSKNEIIWNNQDIIQGVQYKPLIVFNDQQQQPTNSQHTQQKQKEDNTDDSTKKMIAEVLAISQTLLLENRAHKQQMARLTEEVVTLRNEVRQIKISFSTDSNTNLVPLLPLKTLDQLRDLHKETKENEDLIAQLKFVVSKVGGDCCNSFIRNGFKKLLSDEVATKLSWRGTNEKPSIQEFCIKEIVTSMCHSKFPKSDDSAINKAIQQHFVHAADRLRKVDKKFK